MPSSLLPPSSDPAALAQAQALPTNPHAQPPQPQAPAGPPPPPPPGAIACQAAQPGTEQAARCEALGLVPKAAAQERLDRALAKLAGTTLGRVGSNPLPAGVKAGPAGSAFRPLGPGIATGGGPADALRPGQQPHGALGGPLAPSGITDLLKPPGGQSARLKYTGQRNSIPPLNSRLKVAAAKSAAGALSLFRHIHGKGVEHASHPGVRPEEYGQAYGRGTDQGRAQVLGAVALGLPAGLGAALATGSPGLGAVAGLAGIGAGAYGANGLWNYAYGPEAYGEGQAGPAIARGVGHAGATLGGGLLGGVLGTGLGALAVGPLGPDATPGQRLAPLAAGAAGALGGAMLGHSNHRHVLDTPPRWLLDEQEGRPDGDDAEADGAPDERPTKEAFLWGGDQAPATKKRKAPAPPATAAPAGMPMIGLGLGGLSLGSLATARALASDDQVANLDTAMKELSPAGFTDPSKLPPNQTGYTHYANTLSPAAGLDPFGVPAGQYMIAIRKQPKLLDALGVKTGPGGYQLDENTARQAGGYPHYESFARGPIPAYYHLLKKDPAFVSTPADPAVAGADFKGNYADYMGKKFEKFISEAPMGPSAFGGHPMEISPAVMSLPEQKQLLERFHASLTPAEQAYRQKMETTLADAAGNPNTGRFVTQTANYTAPAQGVLKARQLLQDVGVTAGGAGLGALAGYGLYNVLGDPKPKTTARRMLASAAGAGLGGAGAFFLGTERGRGMALDGALALARALKGGAKQASDESDGDGDPDALPALDAVLHRDLDDSEKRQVADRKRRWFPELFYGQGTPLPELLSSPGRGALLHGGLGAALGAAAGAGLGRLAGGQAGSGAAAGAGLGAAFGGAHGYLTRRRSNEDIVDLMRRLPQGATYRDFERDTDGGGFGTLASTLGAGLGGVGSFLLATDPGRELGMRMVNKLTGKAASAEIEAEPTGELARPEVAPPPQPKLAPRSGYRRSNGGQFAWRGGAVASLKADPSYGKVLRRGC